MLCLNGQIPLPPRPRFLPELLGWVLACLLIPVTAGQASQETDFFENKIRPLLEEHCLQCHATKTKVRGGLLLDSAEGWQKGGDTGPALIPGDPAQSLLIQAVRYGNPDLQMPPDGKLPEEAIQLLEDWVKSGAIDPRKPSANPGAHAPLKGMSLEEGLQFWSFRPIQRPTLPEVRRLQERLQSPIDAFILSRLEQEGLEPARRADKRSWIRRVTYDLTGLPPTPEEIRKFLQDESPASWDRVVDRLLESPRYGVRWGRHWLDVARYADSNGLDENLAFGTAWRYRDYVIDSWNQDKPFDQFLIEQLAGDLLPEAGPEQKMATAYLCLGAKVLAEPDREKLNMDTIDEQLDTLGKTFLGMTFGCVRCHDHKFDPLTQRDYYALAAVFKSTTTFGTSNTGAIKHWYEHSFATEADQARVKEADARIAAAKKEATDLKNKAMSALRTAARNHAVDYLVAAARFSPEATLGEVNLHAEPLGLHPRILHHCRLHLAYHSEDPVFQAWHERAKQQDTEGIRQHYQNLFEEAERAYAEARKADPKATSTGNPTLDAARAALNDASGFLAIPPKPEFALDEATLAEYDRLMEVARIVESHAPDLPSAMGVTDGTVQSQLAIHIRGNHRALGEPVDRAFPAVMKATVPQPEIPAQQSGRLELARWLADPDHPLTTRVYVNRIWRWHFGRGLVSTTENFGKLGDRPSHPELLDWLASTFIESGYSTKQLHRLILRSSTYQMASRPVADPALAEKIDPENRLMWKAPTRVLEAEPLRDAILFVTGRLDEFMGGKTVPLRNRQFVFNHTSVDHTKYDSLRRAAYLPVIRNNVYTFFEQFNFPDPTMPTGDRTTTTVAPQALLLMNADWVMDSAKAFAQSLLENATRTEQRIEMAYERALGRLPSSQESLAATRFIEELEKTGWVNASSVDPTVQLQALTLFCQGLLASNEFMYLP